MNKYERALESMIHSGFISQSYTDLKELVDKEKPKKYELHLIGNGQSDQVICPVCGQWLGHPLYFKKYCLNCGQRLVREFDNE